MAASDPQTASSEKSTGRQLGLAESLQHLFVTKYSHGIYWHVGVVQSTLPLSQNDVEKALKILVHYQEAMQMRIVPLNPKQANTFKFKFVPMVDPHRIDFDIINMKTKDDWPIIINQDHVDNKLDHVNGPLWRFILGHVDGKKTHHTDLHVHEYVLFLKIHHAIVDGVSASDLLYHQFLPILSAVVNGRDAEKMFQPIPQTQPLEQTFLSSSKLQNPLPWYFRLGARVLRWKNRTFKPFEVPTLRHPEEDDISIDEFSAICVPKIFGQEMSEKVIKMAKSNGVTVHSVLLVAGAMAFSRTAEEAGVKLPNQFRQFWPVDLRKRLDFATPQPLGYFISMTFSTHNTQSDCTPDAFWQSCKQVYLEVKKESSREKSTSKIGLIKYFLPEAAHHDIETALKETRMDYIIALSNLGNRSTEREPSMAEGSTQIQMTEQFFSLSGPVAFNPFYQMMMTFRGKFMWNIIYHPTKISRKFIDSYYDNLENVLTSFCVQQQIKM